MTTSLVTWTEDPTRLALHVSDERALKALTGGRDLVVPVGCTALLDAPVTRVPAGGRRERPGAFTLVKDDLFAIDLVLDGIGSRDGIAHEARATLSLFVDAAEDASLVRFKRTLVVPHGSGCGVPDVERVVGPLAREALGTFVAGREARELASEDVDEALERHLRRALAPELAARGLGLSRVRRAWFSSPELAAIERARAQRGLTEAAEAERQAALAAQARTKALESELLVAGERAREKRRQELAHELETSEQAHKLALAQKVVAELGGADIGALVSQVADPKAQERLYALLIQRQMTPEQIAAMGASKIEQLENSIGELAKRLAGPTAAAAAAHPATHRFLVACGDVVLAYDPKSNVEGGRARERYASAPHPMGGIRSLRVVRDPGGSDLLLAGARDGVLVLRLDAPTAAPAIYPISPRTGRTGINSAALAGTRLFATHSEFGVLAWDARDPRVAPRALAAQATRGASAVRGALVGGGALWFAADQRVYRLALDALDRDPELYIGPSQPVSGLAWAADRVYAASLDGCVYAWSPADPRSPRRVHARQSKLYGVRARVDALGHDQLLIACRDRALVAHDLVDGRETSYQSASMLRWGDGTWDYVAATDHDGRELVFWMASRPEAELRRIELPEPANDLVAWMKG